MRMIGFWMAAGLSSVLALGCASGAPTTSTVTGTLAQETFPSAVTQITVLDSSGASVAIPVSANGAFSLSLDAGASYRFFLGQDGKSLPIVIKSNAGRLQTELVVQSAGADADLGRVRYWAGSVAARTRRTIAVTTVPTSASCVNGVIEGTTQPCASGDAAVSCAEDDMAGGCPNMGSGDSGGHGDGDHAGGHPAGDTGGADPVDVPVVQSASAATDAAASDAVGMPEVNLPASLACASGGGHKHGGHHH